MMLSTSEYVGIYLLRHILQRKAFTSEALFTKLMDISILSIPHVNTITDTFSPYLDCNMPHLFVCDNRS